MEMQLMPYLGGCHDSAWDRRSWSKMTVLLSIIVDNSIVSWQKGTSWKSQYFRIVSYNVSRVIFVATKYEHNKWTYHSHRRNILHGCSTMHILQKEDFSLPLYHSSDSSTKGRCVVSWKNPGYANLFQTSQRHMETVPHDCVWRKLLWTTESL